MIYTFNEYHLGDNLIHLNYLRKASILNPDKEFTHHCQVQYHEQLKPIIDEFPIYLKDLSIHPNSVNTWIGVNNFFYQHPQCRHWVNFHLDWFTYLSSVLGIANPIAAKRDLLFDYPALTARTFEPFDYLIINSPPMSGQLPDFNPQYFVKMVQGLVNLGQKVITTHPTGLANSTLEWGMDVTQIGNLSNYCQHIIAIDTGPMWTTFNTYNAYSVLSRTIYGRTSDTIDLTANTVCYQKLWFFSGGIELGVTHSNDPSPIKKPEV